MSSRKEDKAKLQKATKTGRDIARPSLPPSRAGKKPVTAYVDKDIHKELRLLGIETEKTTQEMVSEAIFAYLKSHR